MTTPDANRLSELTDQLRDAPEIDQSLSDATKFETRRTFIARSSVLTLAIPGVGAALTACSPSGSRGPDTAGEGRQATGGRGGTQPHNSDSRLDSAVLKGEHHAGTSATGTAAQGGQNVAYHRFAP